MRLPVPIRSESVPGVIDADYVVMDPPVAGEPGAWPALPTNLPSKCPPRGLDDLRPARRERAAVFGRRGGLGFWSFGLALVATAFWIAGGHALVLAHRLPPAPPAAGGLRLTLLDSGVRPVDGRDILAVEAEVANAAARAMPPRPVAVLIVTGNDVTMRYVMAGDGAAIAPGARRRLTSRLPVPPGGVRSVRIDFAS